MKRCLVISIFALLAVSGVAHGTTIATFEFVGSLEDASFPLDLPGSNFTGVFRYDLELNDQVPDSPSLGEYEPLGHGHVTVESERPGVADYLILTSSGSIGVFDNDFNDEDEFFVHGGRFRCSGISAPIVNGFRLCGYDLQLVDEDGLVFDSDSLPLTAPDLEQFENNFFELIFQRVGEPADREFASGVITSLRLISISIPEPGTLGLFGIGLLGLGLIGRRAGS
jgi:hypothetical protein